MKLSTIVALYRSQCPPGYDPRGEDAPPNAAFLATLPEDIRSEPSLKSIQDASALAKSYVHAQKLIGTKRLPVPEPTWDEAKWNEFYDQTGRPKTPDDYKVPGVKLEEGLSLDEAKIKNVKAQFHKLGLSGKQAEGVLEYYLGTLNEGVKGSRAASMQSNEAATAELKAEWGDKYEPNLDLAKATIKKFGDQKLLDYLESSGIGNNGQLIRMLSKIGALTLEDSARGGGSDFMVKDSTRASSEIDNLKTDKDFMAAFTTQNHPGHKAAVEKWGKLHSIAYPGKQGE